MRRRLFDQAGTPRRLANGTLNGLFMQVMAKVIFPSSRGLHVAPLGETAPGGALCFLASWNHQSRTVAFDPTSLPAAAGQFQRQAQHPAMKGQTMKTKLSILAAMLLIAVQASAQDKSYPPAKVSFDDFKGLVAKVETHRASRLVDLDTFLEMSQQPGVIILDTRSAFRYERIHIKGAKHLSFTDFTQKNLQEVIPSFDTTVLIYCNNNFEGNQIDFATKIARPQPNASLSIQFAVQEKPIMMALNIPTYINLYGYGYRNVYELDELVNVNDPRITFEGSIVKDGP